MGPINGRPEETKRHSSHGRRGEGGGGKRRGGPPLSMAHQKGNYGSKKNGVTPRYQNLYLPGRKTLAELGIICILCIFLPEGRKEDSKKNAADSSRYGGQRGLIRGKGTESLEGGGSESSQ